MRAHDPNRRMQPNRFWPTPIDADDEPKYRPTEEDLIECYGMSEDGADFKRVASERREAARELLEGLKNSRAADNTEPDLPPAPRKINLEFRPQGPDTRPLVEYITDRIATLEGLSEDWEAGDSYQFSPRGNPYRSELAALRLVRDKLPVHDHEIRSGQIQTDLLILKESYRQGGFTDHYRLGLIENQEH